MSACNWQFGASGGVAHASVCAYFQVSVLVRAAVTPRLRQAAPTITDKKIAQDLFLDMAKTCDNDSYRIAAAKKLTDKTLANKCLADVVKASECALYSREALAEITDNALKNELRGIVAKKRGL